jgi:hypothetical protein
MLGSAQVLELLRPGDQAERDRLYSTYRGAAAEPSLVPTWRAQIFRWLGEVRGEVGHV